MARRPVSPAMPPVDPLDDETVSGVFNGEIIEPNPLYDPAAVGDEAEMSDDIVLQSALSQIGESGRTAKCIVYRIDPASKRDIYLYDCPVTEFASGGMGEIQQRYGAGDYRVRV